MIHWHRHRSQQSTAIRPAAFLPVEVVLIHIGEAQRRVRQLLNHSLRVFGVQHLVQHCYSWQHLHRYTQLLVAQARLIKHKRSQSQAWYDSSLKYKSSTEIPYTHQHICINMWVYLSKTQNCKHDVSPVPLVTANWKARPDRGWQQFGTQSAVVPQVSSALLLSPVSCRDELQYWSLQLPRVLVREMITNSHILQKTNISLQKSVSLKMTLYNFLKCHWKFIKNYCKVRCVDSTSMLWEACWWLIFNWEAITINKHFGWVTKSCLLRFSASAKSLQELTTLWISSLSNNTVLPPSCSTNITKENLWPFSMF